MTVIDTLSDLVRINSVNPEWDGPGEGEAASYVLNYFRDAGIDTWEDETLPGRPNIMARLPGRDPSRRVLFEVHTDTVSVADMTIPPFTPEIRDGLLYGRGACDVKGGLAAMMHAVREIHESGETPPCEVIFAATVDEEHHYRGVLRLLESLKGGPLPEAAIVAEPTVLRLVRANKGAFRWKIATKGKSAHSSKPHLGVNAIVAMTKVIAALVEDEKRLALIDHPLVGPPTCSIGLIEGGRQINFVPEDCRITIDRRMIPGETGDQVLAEAEALMDRVRAENPGIQIEQIAPPRRDAAMETPESAAVVQTGMRVLESMGLDPEPGGVPYGCDGTKLSRAGIPCIIFAPGSIDQAHGAVEYVAIDQVEKAVEFYRRFLLAFGEK